jgi:xanthine dehydrogenase accessory factor
LIILGGGHIASPLVEFGSKLGFEITVIDDRPIFANKERFPLASKVVCDSFENCFKAIDLNMSCFVVIVTRGHRHDMICLNSVLKHETAYVGMIGSKRRVRIVKENLIENGFTKEKLDNLNAPIGLSIGAVTPEEIAISILAQVIAARRLGKAVLNESMKVLKGKCLEFDVDVMEELIKVSDEPKAIVTIVSTKGSSPRHAGAKMIVWPHGKILGSIGGGCCESEVILKARDIMKEGRGYQFHTIDMTDDAAEEEGMVCGGTMEVLIET